MGSLHYVYDSTFLRYRPPLLYPHCIDLSISIYVYIRLFIYLSIYLSIYIHMHLSILLFPYLNYLPASLSIDRYIHPCTGETPCVHIFPCVS